MGQGGIMRRILIIAPAFLPSPAAAQDTEEPEEIVVTAGLPATPGDAAYATSEIDREQVVSAPSGRIDEVLQGVAGIQQFRRSDSRSSNPTAQGITLRALGGNATSRALVTLDGVPQADPFFGYIPFAAIAPEAIGSVRVTRGGGAGPFGSGALVGTIALASAGPDLIDGALASSSVNDRGETEVAAVFAPRFGEGYLLANARWDRGEGFFTAPEDDRVAASVPAAFDSLSGGVRLVQPVGPNLRAELAGRAFRDERTLRFAGADSRIAGQDLSLRVSGGGDWQVEALAYAQWRDFSNVVVSSTSFVPVLDQRETPSTGFGGKVEIRPPVGTDTILRLGTDLRVAEGEIAEDRISAASGNVFASRAAGGRTSDLGFFAEFDRRFGPLVLTAGLRADRFGVTGGFQRDFDGGGTLTGEVVPADRSDWGVTWRGGAAYEITPRLSARAAAYRGFRQPTLNELYRPFVIFPLVTLANPQLENEELTGFEIGADWRGEDGAEWSLTLFDNRLENGIANAAIGPNLRQRRNLDAIEARGIEASAGYGAGPLRIDTSVAYTDATLASDDSRPPQSPAFSATAFLRWQASERARMTVSLRHVGEQFEDADGADVLPAFTTLGATASYRLAGPLELVLRGENLTDETIVTRNSGGSVDLGVPRTVWLGIRSGF